MSRVHFIYLGGGFHWRYDIAVNSALAIGQSVTIWHTVPFNPKEIIRTDMLLPAGRVEAQPLQVPSWLEGQHLPHVWDCLAYRILEEHGGTCLGLDTISLKPIWPLLTRDLLIGSDCPDPSVVEHPYNNNGVSAPAGGEVIVELAAMAETKIRAGGMPYGGTGPILMSEIVARYPDRVDIAPFPVLCGFEGTRAWTWYFGAPILKETRVLHLFAQAYAPLFSGEIKDREVFFEQYPWAREEADRIAAEADKE